MGLVDVKPSCVYYSVDSLTEAFGKALLEKQEVAAAFRGRNKPEPWVSHHAASFTQPIQTVITWLEQEKSAGAAFIKTIAPIADAIPAANGTDSLFMQIRDGRAQGVHSLPANDMQPA